MPSLDQYYQPTYVSDREESEETLIKCNCWEHCDSYSPTLMLDGYDGDKFYIKHKEQYLENFVKDMSEEDYKDLVTKINKQL